MASNVLLARAAGLIMVVGGVLQIMGSEQVVDDVFGTSDVDVRVEAILASPDAWDRAWTWSAIAITVVALGFVVWASAFAAGHATSSLTRLATLGAAAALIGSLVWVYVCYARATHDPVDIAEDPNIAWWTSLFVPLVMLAVILVGIVIKRLGMVKRGWAVIGLGLLGVPASLLLPLLVPLLAGIVGIVVVTTSRRDWGAPAAEPSGQPIGSR